MSCQNCTCAACRRERETSQQQAYRRWDATADVSAIPHNALEDAKALRACDLLLDAAIEQHKPVVRMLTDGEIADALSGYGMMAKQIQRKFAEVNGLTIGEQG